MEFCRNEINRHFDFYLLTDANNIFNTIWFARDGTYKLFIQRLMLRTSLSGINVFTAFEPFVRI
jgi:hypothetical protein